MFACLVGLTDVGVCDGEDVGATDGLKVSPAFVGPRVVGTAVGLGVVGLAVGLTVGPADGLTVGANVGDTEGEAVGVVVGLKVSPSFVGPRDVGVVEGVTAVVPAVRAIVAGGRLGVTVVALTLGDLSVCMCVFVCGCGCGCANVGV